MSSDPKAVNQSYDPFGEPLATGRNVLPSVLDRRANRAALAVFWTLALLFVAGRVYSTNWPAAHAVVVAMLSGGAT